MTDRLARIVGAPSERDASAKVVAVPESDRLGAWRYRFCLTEGETVIFRIHAAGNPPAAYQWQAGRLKSAFFDIENAAGPQYVRGPLTAADDGVLIRCISFRGAGIRHSPHLRLSVLPREHPLRRAYVPEHLKTCKQSVKGLHRMPFYELWHLLQEIAAEGQRRGKPSLAASLQRLLSPSLGRPMYSLVQDCRAGGEGEPPAVVRVLESAGFIHSAAGLKDRLEAAAECVLAFGEAPGPADLRRRLAASLAAIDGAAAGEHGGRRRSAVESLWAVLDSAEWAPASLRRAEMELERAGRPVRELAAAFPAFLREAMLSEGGSAPAMGLIDQALQPGRHARAHAQPAALEADALRIAFERLTANDPRRFFTAGEIEDRLMESGHKRPALLATRALLDELTGEGVLEWRKGRGEAGYRFKRNTRFPRPPDPAAVFWHGLPREQILRSAEFRRLGDTHLLAAMWGESWKQRLVAEARAHGSTQDDIYAGMVELLLQVYETLRARPEPQTAGQLLENVRGHRFGTAGMDEGETVVIGMKWLAQKGFAIHQEGPAWAVGGLARHRFLDLFVAGWPERIRKEWDLLRQPAPLEIADGAARPERPQDMQRRLELILEVNDIAVRDYYDLDRNGGRWDLRCHQPEGLFLDSALYHTARRLGIEPVLLRVGANRVQLEPHLLRYIRRRSAEGTMTLAQRLVILRRLAGFSRAVLGERIGVSAETIGNLETGQVREFLDPGKWRLLAEALAADLFLLLCGMERREAFGAARTFEERLKLFCQAEGLGTGSLTQGLSGWSTELSRTRRGLASSAAFRERLPALFPRTQPTAEELFGPAASLPAPHAAQKPRGNAGKFKAKAGAQPAAVLRNILDHPDARRSAEQGRLTIREYMELCARGVDASEATFRRTFATLTAQGQLVAGSPPGLYGSTGYGLAESHRSRRHDVGHEAAAGDSDTVPTGL